MKKVCFTGMELLVRLRGPGVREVAEACRCTGGAADRRVGRLHAHIKSCNGEERSALLVQLAGWFSDEPEAEFWTVIEQLTLAERAVEDVSLG